MNKERFDAYLQQPETMNEQSLSDLRQVVKDYPFFAAGRIMLLRNLKMCNDSDYEKELPLTAIYAGSRSIFYNYIFNQNPADKTEPVVIETGMDTDQKTIDDVSEQKKSQFPDRIEDCEIKEAEVTETVISDIPESQLSPDPLPLNPVPQIDGESSVHSFANWLEIMSVENQEASQEAPKKQKSWDLIDNFIQGSPKIPQAKGDISEKQVSNNLADESELHHEEFMTETLAKIYIKQKHYNKAIQIFKKLSLKYPEKSIYFAGQIKIVEQLLNNEK